MKNILTLIFLFALNLAQAQEYFQRRFNFNAYPYVRNERFNGGIRTVNNYDANNTYYYVGVGTSYNNTALSSPHNIADRLRFARMNKAGNGVLSNLGYHFLRDGRPLHARGNSIVEIPSTSGNGGYLAVGAVASNPITGALASGGSDVLLTRLSAGGAVVWSRRIDIMGGSDIAWYIKRSRVPYNNQPTWLICGESRQGSTYTDAFVLRIDQNGNIIWGNHYNFDPGAGQFNSAHNSARQFAEDAAGYIYVVGTLQDNAWANGIDGLAFKLSPAGAVVWASNYHYAADDEFQAVRLSAGGNLVVGGFTNAGGMYNMQITSLTTAAGAIVFQNIVRAGSNGVFYPSKCYDIVETPGPQYYLAGVVTQNNANREMLYRVGAGGVPVSWNSYNPMVYAVGFGLDYIPGSCPGLAYFSSMRNPTNGAFSDGHIMKTDLATKTCNYRVPQPPARLPIYLYRYARQYNIRRAIYPFPLTAAVYNYLSWSICYVNCTSTATTHAGTTADAEAPARPAAQSKLTLAPNPTRHILRIGAQDLPDGEYQLELRDKQGVLIQKRTLLITQGTLSAELDLSAATPGIYLLTVKQGNLVLREKVVKQ